MKAPGRTLRCILRRKRLPPLRNDVDTSPGAGALQAICRVFALRVIASFFHRDQDSLISVRGQEVLRSPQMKAQVDTALMEYRTAGMHGPLVVHFKRVPHL